GPGLGDDCLASIGRMTRLNALAIRDCPNFRGTGLAQLTGLAKLRQLYLSRTALDDAGLTELRKASSLRVLNVSGTPVTVAGIAALHEALPQCVIAWEGGVVLPGDARSSIAPPAPLAAAAAAPAAEQKSDLAPYIQAAIKDLNEAQRKNLDLTLPT